MRKTRGFTLIELLITAGILAMVLIAAGTFLIQSQRSQQATVDLGSRIDSRSFVANLLNYDFRIVCYADDLEDDSDCLIHIDPDYPSIKISYFEDRFGESGSKTVAWHLDPNEHTLYRDEIYSPKHINEEGHSISSVVLRDVEKFTIKNTSRQLLEFTIQPLGGVVPIHVNVAVLNPVSEAGGN